MRSLRRLSGTAVDTWEQSSDETEKAPTAEIPEQALLTILAGVDRLTRPVGRINLAQALRGGRAKNLSRGGLKTMPEYGQLAQFSEDEVVAGIDKLLREERLQRTGGKYPTVWLPGKPIRERTAKAGTGAANNTSNKKTGSRYGGSIARALDNYRKRTARSLGWKPYMVFQTKVMMAIQAQEPDSHAALDSISGLGPAKVDRFGDDILELVERHRSRSDD